MDYEWNSTKSATNLKKHGVSFEEAKAVFDNPLALIFEDELHSVKERREVIIGYSQRSRIMLFSFTERPKAIRIISACIVTQKEREDMKTTPSDKSPQSEDDLAAEYAFDYSKAKLNRFAAQDKE